MTGGTVYRGGWSLDDVQWDKFDRSKLDAKLVAAVKAASLVEFNAPDYVAYLSRVFKHAGPETLEDIKQWGEEESQHGLALGRWAEMADPSFNFKEAFARFREGYHPEHFDSDDETSVRGSRRGEMIARCVVECGTSSYYSAIRDAAEEPVLKEVAGRIAADEFRHYKLFFETLNKQDEPDLSLLKKLRIAYERVNESDDDELSYAYYCANVAKADEAKVPYERAKFARAYNATAIALYRRRHVNKLVQMVAKACGAKAQSWLTRLASAALWRMLRIRAGAMNARAA
jgi:hypothetical protein